MIKRYAFNQLILPIFFRIFWALAATLSDGKKCGRSKPGATSLSKKTWNRFDNDIYYYEWLSKEYIIFIVIHNQFHLVFFLGCMGDGKSLPLFCTNTIGVLKFSQPFSLYHFRGYDIRDFISHPPRDSFWATPGAVKNNPPFREEAKVVCIHIQINFLQQHRLGM